MAPESVRLLYTDINNVSDYLPLLSDQRSQSIGALHIKALPKLTQSVGVSVSGAGGAFNAVIDGTAVLTGRDLLRLPATISLRTASDPILVDRTTIATTTTLTNISSTTSYGPPSVTFAGAALSVSSAQYPPFNSDIVRVSVASLPHNASGFLKVGTSEGTDSIKITVARAPVNGRVVQQLSSGEFPVSTRQLVRGAVYLVRASNLTIVERTSATSFNRVAPTLRLGGNPVPVSLISSDTTLVQFVAPTSTGITGGELIVSHAGGSLSLGEFTMINLPPTLSVSGAVASPTDIIGGTNTTLTVSLTPNPTDFSTAGSLLVTASSGLLASIPPMAPVPITTNPMVIRVPTIATGTTSTGSLTIAHSTNSASNPGSVRNITVRPPRPTTITLADTVAGSRPVSGTVNFDLPGSATVLLSSSDPSLVTVPASVVRSGAGAAFTATTPPVLTERSVTIFASLDGTSVSRTLVLRPGRLIGIDPPSALTGGQSGSVFLAFDIPVTNQPVTLTSSDTSLKINSINANGTSVAVPFTTSPNVAVPVSVTISATAGTVSRTGVVQVNPMQIGVFSAAPTSGPGGSQTAATIRLSRAAIVPQFIDLRSSDSTVVRVPNTVSVPIGTDVLVVPMTFVAGPAGPRMATVTANLRAAGSSGAPIVSTRTLTLTVAP